MKQSYKHHPPSSTSRKPGLTWPVLIILEPRLRLIEQELLAGQRQRGRRLWQQYEYLKARLRPLVGWLSESPHELVTSAAAWELAISHLLGILERPRRRRRLAA